jgi:hypothetical protein
VGLGLNSSGRVAGAVLRLVVVGVGASWGACLALLCRGGASFFYNFFTFHSFDIGADVGALVLVLVGVRAGLGCRRLQFQPELKLVLN